MARHLTLSNTFNLSIIINQSSQDKVIIIIDVLHKEVDCLHYIHIQAMIMVLKIKRISIVVQETTFKHGFGFDILLRVKLKKLKYTNS